MKYYMSPDWSRLVFVILLLTVLIYLACNVLGCT